MIDKYRHYRLKNRIASLTIHREVLVLRRMFSIAVSNGWANDNPCLVSKIKPLREENRKKRYLTPEE